MNVLKLFLAATFAAVVTLVGLGHASANGNRLGTVNLNIFEQIERYNPKPVHYRRHRRYRRYRRHRRHYYRRRHYRHGYYRPYRKRYRHSRRYRHYGYYGPSVYIRVPGFGFRFGY